MSAELFVYPVGPVSVGEFAELLSVVLSGWLVKVEPLAEYVVISGDAMALDLIGAELQPESWRVGCP